MLAKAQVKSVVLPRIVSVEEKSTHMPRDAGPQKDSVTEL